MTMLVMTRGDDRVLDVAVVEEDGTPQDLTGVDLRFTAKRRKADPDSAAVIVKTTPTEITVTDPTGGIAEVAIDAADTADLGEVRLRWDLQGRDTGGKTVTLASGSLAIEADISQTSP